MVNFRVSRRFLYPSISGPLQSQGDEDEEAEDGAAGNESKVSEIIPSLFQVPPCPGGLKLGQSRNKP